MTDQKSKIKNSRREYSMGSLFRSKVFYVCCFLAAAVVGIIVFFYFTNEGVATELRQIRQPNPNLFYVGIDVSATIDSDMLDDFKSNIADRLRNFIGDDAVFYHISSFGNPGCGISSVRQVVSTKAPADETTFKYEVEEKIQGVSPALNPKPGKPLTTPLYCLLRQVLTEKKGRIIIFSDLLNEESDCPTIPCPFPEREITKFGQDKQGQIIFIYPAPHEMKIKDQQDFIIKMRKLSNEGKVRAYFYQVPDDPEDIEGFMKSKLQSAIPATTYEIIWERASRIVDTIVSAVRG